MCKFEEIYSLNVNDKVEKKGQLSYLSWAWAWAEFKKKYPKASYTVDRFDGTYCTGNEKLGWMVRTEVFADDLTYEMWLPIMDMRNNAILSPKMTDVNKTIMRCLTKNLAMFGLGLYIYAGEDLPEDVDGEEQPKPIAKPPQNTPKTPPKTNDKPKVVETITRSELVQKYGVENPEKTILWLEGKVGKEIANFDEDDTTWARAQLEAGKKKRDAEKRKAALERVADEDLPFTLGDE
jgi:hypothetical protein